MKKVEREGGVESKGQSRECIDAVSANKYRTDNADGTDLLYV